MQKGDLLDLQTGYDRYNFGNEYYLKLYEEHVERKWIEAEYYKANYINSIYEKCIVAKEIVEVEGRVGIVYPKIKGNTVLYLFETNDISVEIEAQKFAAIHAKMHAVKCYELLDQTHYYKDQIQKCDYITKEDKIDLLKRLKELPEKELLCHGNFHVNNVLLTKGGYKILDVSHAYKGHPMSDVAKACLIMDVPRPIEGATHILQEEMIKLRSRMIMLYLESYKEYGDYDEDLCAEFYRFAAVDRLNEHHEHEKEWLLHIIKD